jgi:hypothetical protein
VLKTPTRYYNYFPGHAVLHAYYYYTFLTSHTNKNQNTQLLITLNETSSTDNNGTFLLADGNTCFYGKCYYCRKEEAACANGEVMEGSVTLWLPEWYELKTHRHPYQRTYRPNHKAK